MNLFSRALIKNYKVVSLEEYRAPDGGTHKGVRTTLKAWVQDMFDEDIKKITEHDIYPNDLLKSIKSYREQIADTKKDYYKDVAYVPIEGLVQYLMCDDLIIKKPNAILKHLDAIEHYCKIRSNNYFHSLGKALEELSIIAANINKNVDTSDNLVNVFKYLNLKELSTIANKDFIGGWQLSTDTYLGNKYINILIKEYEIPDDRLSTSIEPFNKEDSIRIIDKIENITKLNVDTFFDSTTVQSATAFLSNRLEPGYSQVLKEIEKLDPNNEKHKIIIDSFHLIIDKCAEQHFNIVIEINKTLKTLLRVIGKSMYRWHSGF